MSLDLTGIVNRNEYYTNHYFSAIFADNARTTISDWRLLARDSDFRAPWSRLRDVGTKYYVLRDQYLRNGSGDSKAEIVQNLSAELLSALDYDPNQKPETIEIEEELTIPVYLEMQRANKTPLLWVLVADGGDSEVDLLNHDLSSVTHQEQTDNGGDSTNEDLVSKIFFAMDEPPRWIILIGINQVILLDRSKWNEKRYLLFELDDILDGEKRPHCRR